MTVETVEVARMRRYDDPVEVRRGMVSGEQGPVEGPEQFLWHGRLWKVYDVVGHWRETGAWWQSREVAPVLGADRPAAGSRRPVPRCTTCWGSGRSGGWRPGAAGPPAAASSTSSSTGPRAAGSSPGAGTDRHDTPDAPPP